MPSAERNIKGAGGDDDGTTFPTPQEIIDLAELCGYAQRRGTASATLFFVEADPPHGMPPCRINVYYTTRSIMTHLNHPGALGSNELWRSNAYDDVDELRTFFRNPRIHTGKGYRNAEKAVRGCVCCGEMRERSKFSNNQWTKGPDANKCMDCAASGGIISDLSTALEGINLTAGSGGSLPLTEGVLAAHDGSTKNVAQDRMERRQFNCPDCPRHGRGNFVFFKKVPSTKPIVKCPQCKKASRGRCKRLYPINRESEKGYGLYKCHRCGDKWGSSRAVRDIAQECYSCLGNGAGGIMVAPFRLEVVKKKMSRGGGGTRRVPKEPIREDEADEREYGTADRERNFSAGGNALVGGLDGSATYDVQDTQGDADDSSENAAEDQLRYSPPSRIPEGYTHKCAGCASGICNNKSVPKSEVHDISDGNTVSTSASVVTNSSIDKSDFVDRDEDFSGFDENEEEDWIDV